MSSQGPNLPTVAVNDNSIGNRAWLNPGGDLSDGGGYAAPSGGVTIGNQMNFLRASGFGFSVPEDAGPVTVTFTVTKKRQGLRQCLDAGAFAVVDGAIGTDDQSQTAYWPTSFGTVDYAFSGLTAAQVNDTSFGFALSAIPLNTPPDHDVKLGTVPCVDLVTAVAEY